MKLLKTKISKPRSVKSPFIRSSECKQEADFNQYSNAKKGAFQNAGLRMKKRGGRRRVDKDKIRTLITGAMMETGSSKMRQLSQQIAILSIRL